MISIDEYNNLNSSDRLNYIKKGIVYIKKLTLEEKQKILSKKQISRDEYIRLDDEEQENYEGDHISAEFQKGARGKWYYILYNKI